MNNENLFNLIKQSKNVLITSHFSPDPDAIGSALFVFSILKRNFPEKSINVGIESAITNSFAFLKGIDELQNGMLIDTIRNVKPDLFIMLDGNNYKRFAKPENEVLEIEQYVKDNSVKTVIIDHHLEEGKFDSDIFINNKSSSTAEEVFMIFAREYGFEATLEEKEAVLFGIIADTGRFLYKNEKYRQTYDIVAELLDAGLSIEKLQENMTTLTPAHILITSELMKNFTQKDDYNYSYVSDEFVVNLKAKGITPDIYVMAYHLFMDFYIRSVAPNKWGFVLLPDMNAPQGYYKGSFRAVSDLLDTTVFAKQLEGGGHKPASGFKVHATSISEAINIVHSVIAKNKEAALANK